MKESFALLSGLLALGCLVATLLFIGMHSGMYFTKEETLTAFQQLGTGIDVMGQRIEACEKKLGIKPKVEVKK